MLDRCSDLGTAPWPYIPCQKGQFQSLQGLPQGAVAGQSQRLLGTDHIQWPKGLQEQSPDQPQGCSFSGCALVLQPLIPVLELWEVCGGFGTPDPCLTLFWPCSGLWWPVGQHQSVCQLSHLGGVSCWLLFF